MRVVLLFLSITSLLAQEPHPTESQVKAAYLFNFGKFVRWQPDRVSSADSFDICVLGNDPFGRTLDTTVAGESIDGKRIVVKRISGIHSTLCHILFVGSSEESRLASILATAQQGGMLTVSDIPHFAERGGIVGFVTQQGRIRFEVNRVSATQSHLSLSSELLKVSTKVIEKGLPDN